MKFLSKFLRIFKNRRDNPAVGSGEVVRTNDEDEVADSTGVMLGNVMLVTKKDEGSLLVFLGALPLSYTLGMLLSHTPPLCGIVRNMALWLSESMPRGETPFLSKVARHGGIDPTRKPFSPLDPDEQLSERTPFVAELSYYEVAQICMCIHDMREAFMEANIHDKKSEIVFDFWHRVWEQLPATAKMSIMGSGGTSVN